MASSNEGVAAQLGEMRELLDTASPVRARKAVRELVVISDDGEALELAARFGRIANYSPEQLLRLWPQAADPDRLLRGPARARLHP